MFTILKLLQYQTNTGAKIWLFKACLGKYVYKCNIHLSPAQLGQRYTLDRSPVHGREEDSYIFLDCGRKSKYLRKSHTDTRRTEKGPESDPTDSKTLYHPLSMIQNNL